MKKGYGVRGMDLGLRKTGIALKQKLNILSIIEILEQASMPAERLTSLVPAESSKAGTGDYLHFSLLLNIVEY